MNTNNLNDGKGPESSPLSSKDLATGIVEVLILRPKNSCKRSDLTKFVLQHLKAVRRGRDRKNIDKRVTNELGRLKQLKIVVAYKAKNNRLKLASDYEEKYERLKKRITNNNAPDNVHLDRQNGLEHSNEGADSETFGGELATDQRSSYIKTLDIPDLADHIPHADDFFVEDIEDDDIETEDDEQRLLNILTGSTLTTTDLYTDDGHFNNEIPEIDNGNLPIDSVQKILAELPDLQVKRVFNDLRFAFAIDGAELAGTATFNLTQSTLQVRVILPFIENLAIELLHLFGQDVISSILGVARHRGATCYVVRNGLAFRGLGNHEIAEFIQRTLSDAVRATEILRDTE